MNIQRVGNNTTSHELHSSNNLTKNNKLQVIYNDINSSNDYFFVRQGIRALSRLSKLKDQVSSCDVWELLENANIIPNNPRSMGLVFKIAAKNNMIERTDNYRPSRRKQANQRPVRIWRLV